MSGNLYPEGIDSAWLASDRVGHLAAFITAGIGPIPIGVLNCEYVQLEEIEMLLCEMPRVSTARLLVSVMRPDDFVDLAERGIFVYDWRDTNRSLHTVSRGYIKVAVPNISINVSMLPLRLAEMAREIEFDAVFSENSILDVSKFSICSYSESATMDGGVVPKA